MSLLGFYELENIKSRAVVNIMIYISLRFNLKISEEKSPIDPAI